MTPATAAAKPNRHIVLCIDDSLLVRRMIQLTLGNRVELHSADSAHKGLALALSHHPDLIISDINMPGMDGYQMLATLRSHPVTRDIPVVALTSANRPEEVERGRSAGFSDYITKSADVSRLLQTVARHLNPPRKQPETETA